jgi:hypothetical protein
VVLAAYILSGGASATAEPLFVDTALLIASDVSGSMTEEDLDLLRGGVVSALRDPTVIDAALSGRHGRAALGYLEWAGPGTASLRANLRAVEDAAGFEVLAREILNLRPPPEHQGRDGTTAMGDAIQAAYHSLGSLEIVAERRVIDVSGNGVANAGVPVSQTRDWLVGQGITINGLPIGAPHSPVIRFYDECVVGGWGAFRFRANDLEDYSDAMRQKMRLEFTWRPEGGRVLQAVADPGDVRFAGSAPACDSTGWTYGNVKPPGGH